MFLVKLKIFALLLGTALTAQAQQVTLVSPPSMQFSDPANGVTFRYPAKWNFSGGSEFYTPASIAAPASPRRGSVFFNDVRGVVFFKDDGGFNPYPNTNLSGAEFVYVNRKPASARDCSDLALKGDPGPDHLWMINNILYTYAEAESAGMCHQAQEDIYATYRNQTCYLFDLVIHTICPGVKDHTRALTLSETGYIHASLEKILSSVKISDIKN